MFQNENFKIYKILNFKIYEISLKNLSKMKIIKIFKKHNVNANFNK